MRGKRERRYRRKTTRQAMTRKEFRENMGRIIDTVMTPGSRPAAIMQARKAFTNENRGD